MNPYLILFVSIPLTYFILKKIFFPYGLGVEISQHYRAKAIRLNERKLIANIAHPFLRRTITGYYNIDLENNSYQRQEYLADASFSITHELQMSVVRFAIRTVKSEDQHWLRKHSVFAKYVCYLDVPLLRKKFERYVESYYANNIDPYKSVSVQINNDFSRFILPASFSNIKEGTVNIYPKENHDSSCFCC